MVVVVYVLHRVAWPFTAAWINRNCESEYRATVFSIHEQANSFGQVVFGPAMGLLATVRGLRTALIGVAILLVPPQLLYLVKEAGGGMERYTREVTHHCHFGRDSSPQQLHRLGSPRLGRSNLPISFN